MQYFINKLDENDWEMFKRIRLRALQTDPTVFGSNYDREANRTEAEWRDQLANLNTAVFVVFKNDRPVGVTGAAVDRHDVSQKTVLLWGSWVEPDGREKGISKLFYEARIAWAREQPGVERITVSHRESNVASKYANQRFGFVFTHETTKVWNDGTSEREFHYELTL